MREIKFRCWNAHSKVMHDWGELVGKNKIHLLANQKTSYPVMQFTGMLDKHGMPIFEGDIIHWHGFNLEVKFIVDGWFAETADESITEAGQEWESSCAVIGNIHQHAHLLEQNKC